MGNVSVIDDERSYSFKDTIANSKLVKISKMHILKKKADKLMKRARELEEDNSYYNATINENNKLQQKIESNLSKLENEINILETDISKPIKREGCKPLKMAGELFKRTRDKVANYIANSLIRKGYGDFSREVEPMIPRMKDIVIPTDRKNTNEENKYTAMNNAVNLSFGKTKSTDLSQNSVEQNKYDAMNKAVDHSFGKAKPTDFDIASKEIFSEYGGNLDSLLNTKPPKHQKKNEGQIDLPRDNKELNNEHTKPLPKKVQVRPISKVKTDINFGNNNPSHTTTKEEFDITFGNTNPSHATTQTQDNKLTLEQQLEMIKAAKKAVEDQNKQMANMQKKYEEESKAQDNDIEARKVAAAKQILEKLTAQQTANNEKLTEMANNHEKTMEEKENNANDEIAKMFAEAGVEATDEFKPKGYSF